MTHYYCSTFSEGYAYKGLLLYSSLLRWDKDFHFFMICLHDRAADLFQKMNLQRATIIPISAVERGAPQLLAVKETRNDQEYAWTAKASVMLHILERFPETDHIVWLDGDTFFFSSPDPIFTEWGRRSVLLTGERWTPADRRFRYRYGRYNTGFMGFKRDAQALRCLQWFQKNLIQWCSVKRRNSLWSDQVYVNDWPRKFSNVGVIRNFGVNVTPYIASTNRVVKRGDQIYINGEQLILYHYSKFKYFDGNTFDLCSYVNHFSDEVLQWIYLPYVRACNAMVEQIRTVDRRFYRATAWRDQFIGSYFNLKVNEQAGAGVPHLCTLLTRDYLAQGLALYYSLKRHTPRFRLWVLCVDDRAYDLLAQMNLDSVILLSLRNIRSKKLAGARRTRQVHEFCWTLKPALVSYLLSSHFNLDSILYMDADLFLFKDVREIYAEWGKHSIFLTRLQLSPRWERRRGRYSAGLVGFKRDPAGMSCVRSWLHRCLRWCYDRQEYGLWGDQKYLNDWPHRFPGVKISANRGLNVGPWNIGQGEEVRRAGSSIYFNGAELLCYHYSGFEIVHENEFVWCKYNPQAARAESIYSSYLDAIRQSVAQIRSLDHSFFSSGSTHALPNFGLTGELAPSGKGCF